MNNAQADLELICQHSLSHSGNLKASVDFEDDGAVADVAVGVISAGTAVAAIPTVASLSTISAGGFLGLLGATAISWPVVLTGGAVVAVLSAFGVGKVSNSQDNAKKRYKKQIRISIHELVLSSESNESVCRKLQLKINEMASEHLTKVSQ